MGKTTQRAFARAGLLGNPSDGFGGKTLSFAIGQYAAEVDIEPSRKLEIVPQASDLHQYDSVQSLVQQIDQHGYYGAIRLIKAAIKRFYEYLQWAGLQPDLKQNFSIAYRSSIPRAVGMAGSSAIIVATLRALESFYNVTIEPNVIPSLALSVERNELGIPAGLQDRVIQCYEGLVYMNFDPAQSSQQFEMECGNYERLEKPDLFDKLYVAFGDEAGQPTEVLHNDLTKRFREGEPSVVSAMNQFASIAEQGRLAIIENRYDTLNELIDANFDLRRSICHLHPSHIQMVETARKAGASAKYCGSGGAIVGLCSHENFESLCRDLSQIQVTTLRPEFVSPKGS